MNRIQCSRTISYVTLPEAVSYDILPNASVVTKKSDGTYFPENLYLRLCRVTDGVLETINPLVANTLGNFVIDGKTIESATGVLHKFSDATNWPLNVSFVRKSDSATLAATTINMVEAVEGPEGAVMRLREFAANTYYNNGTVEEVGVKYLDIVFLTDTMGRPSYYQCINPHTSKAGDNPKNMTNYWMALMDMTPIYTPLLLADNARIRFINGQEIVLLDSNGNIYGRLGSALPSGSVFFMGGVEAAQATYNMDSKGKTRFGLAAADHIVIDPNDRSIKLYSGEAENTLCGTFAGREVPMFGSGASMSASTTAASLNGTASNTQTTKLWSGAVSAGANLLVSGLKVSMNVGRSTVENGIILSDATVVVRLSIVNDTTGKSIAEETLRLNSVETQNGTLSRTLSLQADGLAAGTYSVQAYLSASVGGTKELSWSAKVDAGVGNVSVSFSKFRLYIGSNGISIGSNGDNYTEIINNGTHQTFLTRSNGHAFKSDKEGLFQSIGNSAWQRLPVTLWHGAAWKDGSTWKAASVQSLDNAAPTVNVSNGEYTISFPAKWGSCIPGINAKLIDNFAVHATGTTPVIVGISKPADGQIKITAKTADGKAYAGTLYVTLQYFY